MNQIKIICTLGPSSFKKKIIQKLKKQNVNIYRINLSHTKKDEIKNKILYLKRQKVKNICLDTEGAQVRTTSVQKDFFLKKNSLVRLSCEDEISNKKNIYLYPKFDISLVPLNTQILIGFDNLSLKVFKKNISEKNILCKVIKSGYLQSKKGVHIDYPIKLGSLTDKDIYALKLGKKMNINHYAISFVNSSKDIEKVKKIVGFRKNIISKIETLNAIKDLKNISKNSNALLIDRGDLSRYIPIEAIPMAQEKIIKRSKVFRRPVYVATNLLENMIEKSQPTRAESNDIYSSLKQGAKGLVLAAETAIGKDPIECVSFLKKCINIYKSKKMFL
ncbi:pyruvate kinase [Candidatus Pelagibacter sp.]|nr:pyruvate kinase [Candidatus Pelagibacter sp.]